MPRRSVPRPPSRSVTLLAIVAVATWAAVWWIERQRLDERTSAVMAHADTVDGEAVTR